MWASIICATQKYLYIQRLFLKLFKSFTSYIDLPFFSHREQFQIGSSLEKCGLYIFSRNKLDERIELIWCFACKDDIGRPVSRRQTNHIPSHKKLNEKIKVIWTINRTYTVQQHTYVRSAAQTQILPGAASVSVYTLQYHSFRTSWTVSFSNWYKIAGAYKVTQLTQLSKVLWY